MKDLRKRVAYADGLLAGLDVDNTKEGRVLRELVEVMDDMAEAIMEIHQDRYELERRVEALADDLADLEAEIFGDTGFEEDESPDEQFIRVECPNCREEVHFPAELADSDERIEVTCPNCEVVVFSNRPGYRALEGDAKVTARAAEGTSRVQ